MLRLRGGHAALSANAEGMGGRASEKAADRRPATEQRKRPLPAGVSEAMKAAVRDDNPEHVLRLLGKPAATRTDTATGGAGLMRSST